MKLKTRGSQVSRASRRRRLVVVGATLATVAGLVPGFVTPASANGATPPPTFDLYDAFQAGSQILVEMDSNWTDPSTGAAFAVTPEITNYEYSTDGGVSWRAFSPPISTPVYNDNAGDTPWVGICLDSATGEPLVTGEAYDIALRAVNADGSGAASSVETNVAFVPFDFYEMNPCGGTWGGQDLKIMTGGNDGYSWFNTFGILRGGLQQIYQGYDEPGDYCFYIFAQSSAIGCKEKSLSVAPGVSTSDWQSISDPIITQTGNTWTIQQTGSYTFGADDTYTLDTTLEYTAPNAYIDVTHVLTTPDVSDLQVVTDDTVTSGSANMTVTNGTGIQVGMCVSGAGIAPGTVVKAISGSSVTLDRNATSNVGSGTATFSACAKIYHGSDMYLDGSDDGPGAAVNFSGNLLVAQITDPSAVDPAMGINGGIGGILEGDGYPFTSWAEGYYSCMFGGNSCPGSPYGINYGGSWPNTVDPNPGEDAGTAAEWSVNPGGASGAHTVQTQIFFGAGSPSLSGGFPETTASVGDTVNLTVNLNNAPKYDSGSTSLVLDWQDAEFDLDLPAGATAGTPTSTCSATVSVATGVLQFSNGVLTDDTLSCSVTVPLTFPQPGTYSVSSEDISGSTITSGISGSNPQGLIASVSGSLVVAGTPPNPDPPGPDPVFPPSAPVNVRASAGNTTATVSWSAPAQTGSFPVSTYKATSRPGGKSCLVAAPALTCVVTGLTNGVSYTFTLEALNGAGWSAPGGPSNPVTPSGTPTPTPVLDPVPVPPLTPGESYLTVDGNPKSVEVDPNAQSNGLDITGDDFAMNLQGLDGKGQPLQLGPNGVLILNVDRQVQTTGTGFQPTSDVDLYLNPPTLLTGSAGAMAASSGGIYLGTVKTNSTGDFAGTATLPPGIEPGDHVIQAVGLSKAGAIRAVSLGVRVLPSLDLNQGTRAADGRHDRIRTTGTSTGIPAGTRLTPFIRYSGQTTFSQGRASIVVQADGSFKWTRQIRKDKAVTGYVTWTDIESNKVTWAKVR